MFTKFNEAIMRLFARAKDEEGQALAEYGLILGLIAIVAIAGLTVLGTALTGTLDSIGNTISGAGS